MELTGGLVPRRERALRNGALLAALLSALTAGCAEDVGECYTGDGKGGQDTVLRLGHVEFAGQAIINSACASGCHQSGVKGEGRRGAPAGLDFDVLPIAPSRVTEVRTNDAGVEVAVAESADIISLRERQLRIFNMRNRIWQQVKDNLMPPDGMFQGFKNLMGIRDTDETAPCAAKSSLSTIEAKASQDILRNWLACKVPIVETYGGSVGADGIGGAIGNQYLACGAEPTGDAGAGDGGMDMPSGVSFERVYSTIFEGDPNCAGCHPTVNDTVDLSTVQNAYEALVGDTAGKCGDKPFVTPNDPDNSFLIDLVSKDSPCDSRRVMRMPVGVPLTDDEIALIADWISAGAMPPSSSLVRVARPADSPLKGGLDGGL